ncbi:MAG TPA: GAF domain-containing protein, partial [Bradyrhizobium sp.]|nr:GAF domain-containing protein [Bradyrhizobium sp.]
MTTGRASGRKTKRRKTIKPPRRTATAPAPRTGNKKKIALLTRELREAVDQQTATSEILRVISSSPTDVQPVFDMIAQSAARLCKAQFCHVFRFDGELMHFAASHGLTPEGVETMRSVGPVALGRGSAAARSMLSGTVEEIPDVHADPDYEYGDTAKIINYRSIVVAPMLKDGRPIGSIAMARSQTGRFPDSQIKLLKTFANQAVIAIENVRSFGEIQARSRELSESLEQQTATAEVLGVISSSPGELEPVFQAMLANATRLCEASYGALWLCEGDAFRCVAIHGALPEPFAAAQRSGVFRPGPGIALARVAKTRQTVQIADLRTGQAYLDREPLAVAAVELAGIRTLMAVPMLKENELIGVISIYRQEVRPFTDKQIALVTSFAAQAVIAIENARLLNELRESLDQQTATSQVLGVISSSPGELEPVFDTILANATRLCEASHGTLWLCEGDAFRRTALHGTLPEAFIEGRGLLFHPAPEVPFARAAKTRQTIHVADMRLEKAYVDRDPRAVAAVEVGGIRTLVAVPMLNENEAVGVISIYRQEVRPFTEKQIALVTSFASQAVIAIENVRLLNELRESLEQQTATADVLNVISRSPTDVQPVFEIIGERAERLCAADVSVVSMVEGELIHLASLHGVAQEGVEAV